MDFGVGHIKIQTILNRKLGTTADFGAFLSACPVYSDLTVF